MDEFDDILLDDYDIEQEINQSANTTTNPTPSTEQEVANEVSDKKPLQKRAKLDEERLLDTNGIYALKNRSQYLTFKGKGHEEEDLKNLMQFYMFWANNLFPKLKFQDFAKRVTKPASSARVKAIVKEWQDEYKERRQVRLDLDKEISAQGAESEDEHDPQEEDASSEDDHRPLFIPITKPLPSNKPKAKKITKKPSRQQEEEPLFNLQQHKRKMVSLDDSDEEEKEGGTKSRQDILALLQQKRKKKEEARKQEEERTRTTALEKKKAELEKSDQAILQDDIELELSDNELMELNIPSADNDQEMQDIE